MFRGFLSGETLTNVKQRFNVKVKFTTWGRSHCHCGLFQWLSGKESVFNAGDLGSVPGLGRFPGGGNGYPLQYSCLENPINREAWRATVHGVIKIRTQLLN